MSLLGITTFLFSLGFITLVLNATMEFQDNSVNACYYVWETTTCLMVRLRYAFWSFSRLHQWLYSVLYAIQSVPGAR